MPPMSGGKLYPISEKKNSFMTSLHSCVSTKHFFLFILNDENHQVPFIPDFLTRPFPLSTPTTLKNVHSHIHKINIAYTAYVKLKIKAIIMSWSSCCCDFEKIRNGSSIALTYTCKFYLRKPNYWRASMICIGLPLKGRTSTVNKQYRLTQ